MSAESTPHSGLRVEQDGRLRILTFDRAERRNALTPELHHALQEAVLAAAADASVGAVLLTGQGAAFCAGGDVNRSSEAARQAPETQEQRADRVREHGLTVRTLATMPKPTIAYLNGAAAGSGMAIALACDLRIMHRDAVMRTAYAAIGLPGDLGMSYFLRQLVGPSKALELLMLNPKLASAECLSLGLANLLCNDAAEALEVAQRLANGPGIAFRHMKQNVGLAGSAGLAEVIDREADATARCVRTADVKEAALAFREKRAPNFTGS